MIETFQPGSFEFARSSDLTAARPQVLTYFSFVTLSTVGYGDVLPVSPTTRACACMEAVAGQFYLAVIVAGLVSMLVVKRSSEA
jgi:voltage-gated potassium channel